MTEGRSRRGAGAPSSLVLNRPGYHLPKPSQDFSRNRQASLYAEADHQGEADEREKNHVEGSERRSEDHYQRKREPNVGHFPLSCEAPSPFWNRDHLPAGWAPIEARLDPVSTVIAFHGFSSFSGHWPLILSANIRRFKKFNYPARSLEGAEKLPIDGGKTTWLQNDFVLFDGKG